MAHNDMMDKRTTAHLEAELFLSNGDAMGEENKGQSSLSSSSGAPLDLTPDEMLDKSHQISLSKGNLQSLKTFTAALASVT
ncbi:unnamed protein product [Protopolystoma xenopodis]|uniref:Uncharacterized protein n=1 Tax=Protopolystoma xenopodis TaxID=117903 RepID=A0A448WSY0_9PLAT|nr:unnamed protein product [Protopolystoma xenopodis]